jgi:hypothetical protein
MHKVNKSLYSASSHNPWGIGGVPDAPFLSFRAFHSAARAEIASKLALVRHTGPANDGCGTGHDVIRQTESNKL